jgi:hypothetical protein
MRETYISATTLETLGELYDILDTYYAKANSKVKTAMAYLVADKDALLRFDPQCQRAIDKISHGSEWFADRRFKRLHESIRRSGIPYMKCKDRAVDWGRRSSTIYVGGASLAFRTPWAYALSKTSALNWPVSSSNSTSLIVIFGLGYASLIFLG